MPPNKPKVYFASKLTYARRLWELALKWNLETTSRWLSQADLELKGSPSTEEFGIFWLVDEEDVRRSDALIVYGEADDILKGALVEVGMAIALGKLVICVGASSSFGSWTNHPLVLIAPSLEGAVKLIRLRFGE